MQLIAQGAEARIYRDVNGDLVKERFVKRYRHAMLDGKINKHRVRKEAKSLKHAAQVGIVVPPVLSVDVDALTIRMGFVDGVTLKTVLASADVPAERKREFGVSFGHVVGRLHAAGLVHGDLTTSNAMVRHGDQALVLIDFGLAQSTRSVEDFAVDLYVLERALLSAHPNSEDIFAAVREGYRNADAALYERTAKQFETVEARGRKKVAFG